MVGEWTPATHPGLRAVAPRPDYLYLEETKPPRCDRHGTDLTPVTNVDGLTLRNGHEVLACSWCFRDSGRDVDTGDVAGVIADNWDDYADHFEESNPPGDDGYRSIAIEDSRLPK